MEEPHRHQLPEKLDIHTHSTPEQLEFVFNGPVDALHSFKVKGICEDSPHDNLTGMELSSPNTIYHLSQPKFTTIFRSLVVFKVDVREMRAEVDILA